MLCLRDARPGLLWVLVLPAHGTATQGQATERCNVRATEEEDCNTPPALLALRPALPQKR